MRYKPDAGDFVWTDFDPRVGREQSGRRPALVVSPRAFWRASGFASRGPSVVLVDVRAKSAALLGMTD